MLVGGFTQFVISQFYQKFATDTLLLDSALIGAIFFVSRVTDALLDPLCGYASDKTGRRKIFIVAGLLALLAGVFSAFAAVLFPTQIFLKYTLTSMGIFLIYLGVTLVYIPHFAWLSQFQKDEPQLPFFASRAVVENMGTILGGVALLVIVPLQQQGASLLFVLLAATGFLALLGGTPLFLYPEKRNPNALVSYSLKNSVRTLFQNRPFRLVALMSFCNQFAATTLIAVSLYYTDYVLQNKELGVTLAILFLLSATAGVPLWVFLAKRSHRHRVWRFALWSLVFLFPTILLTQWGYTWYLSVFAVLGGFFAGALLFFVPQEVSFVTSSQTQDEGIYFAAFMFVNKSSMALAPLVIGLGLKAVDYSPIVRTPQGSMMITVLFIAVPGLAFLASALFLRAFMRLSAPQLP